MDFECDAMSQTMHAGVSVTRSLNYAPSNGVYLGSRHPGAHLDEVVDDDQENK